ncbi:MAG: hypothetical protein R3C11_24475 [Planctomycetaceae bacterium]
MNKLVHWAVSNRPAMNILMIFIIIFGWYYTTNLKRELFQNSKWNK